jgi:hypothetical protein
MAFSSFPSPNTLLCHLGLLTASFLPLPGQRADIPSPSKESGALNYRFYHDPLALKKQSLLPTNQAHTPDLLVHPQPSHALPFSTVLPSSYPELLHPQPCCLTLHTPHS